MSSFLFPLSQISVVLLDNILSKELQILLLPALDMLMTLTCSLAEFLKILQMVLLLGRHLDASSRDRFRTYAKETDCGMRTKKMDSMKVNQMASLNIVVNFHLSESYKYHAACFAAPVRTCLGE